MRKNRMLSRRNWMSAIVVLSIVLAVILLYPSGQEELNTEPLASQGELDLTNWDMAEDGIVNLKGEWEFYWNELLTAADFANGVKLSAPQFVQVPNVWTDYYENGNKYPGDGYATYR